MKLLIETESDHPKAKDERGDYFKHTDEFITPGAEKPPQDKTPTPSV